jgi:hypothetical protein
MPRSLRALAALLLAVGAAGCAGNPCTPPLDRCGDRCLDLRSDARNCGSCGNVCGAGLACVSSSCVPDALAGGCSARTGGAFVTLEVCAESVKVWVSSAYAPEFIARAQDLASNPSSPGPTTPQLGLFDGTDCDGQWTWHVDPANAAWVAAPANPPCSACPSQVEATKSYFLVEVGTWCPDPAVQGVRVLSVDVR